MHLNCCCYLTETAVGMQMSVKMILFLDLKVGIIYKTVFKNEIIRVCGLIVIKHHQNYKVFVYDLYLFFISKKKFEGTEIREQIIEGFSYYSEQKSGLGKNQQTFEQFKIWWFL